MDGHLYENGRSKSIKMDGPLPFFRKPYQNRSLLPLYCQFTQIMSRDLTHGTPYDDESKHVRQLGAYEFKNL